MTNEAGLHSDIPKAYLHAVDLSLHLPDFPLADLRVHGQSGLLGQLYLLLPQHDLPPETNTASLGFGYIFTEDIRLWSRRPEFSTFHDSHYSIKSSEWWMNGFS